MKFLLATTAKGTNLHPSYFSNSVFVIKLNAEQTCCKIFREKHNLTVRIFHNDFCWPAEKTNTAKIRSVFVGTSTRYT